MVAAQLRLEASSLRVQRGEQELSAAGRSAHAPAGSE